MKPLLLMNTLLVALLLACKRPDDATATLPLPPAVTPPASQTVAPTTRKLVWADEFSTPGLPDSTKWGYEVGGNGWGNNELQFYTRKRPENARVEGGKLIIEARRETWENRGYTSARLLTRPTQTWTYGRIEAYARLPKGRGTWPAVWMLGKNISTAGWPRCGEIDIMEHVGYDEGMVHGSIHSESYNHVKGTQKTNKLKLADVVNTFHLYAIEWTVDQIDFYIDDQQYYSVQRSALGNSEAQWPFNQPFYLILNLAVGGNWGGQQGVDETIWPQRMEVDYVRVYQ
ncbi:glycoside hydrolase family 16 protein [Spirosoma sordidisoli]|uniref:Glycoside hydrolase family 16 protein n=1 Tax=Spirosoma sordidisoli TaxID=2502893 RepID=A0A4Q2UV69_9BACT|nr:glycoside hydrolase family 16 protein [Spirosoma sordidisoli]RYC70819.1 glycoside hydrolase family 16 protein [Spirosoma sordidisoli]